MDTLKPRKIDICLCAKNRNSIINIVLKKIESITKDLDCNIILVDGFSKDGTSANLYDFKRDHEDNCIIKQIKDEESYIEAYNLAMSLTSSEYVCWLDSDDLCDDNKLKIQSQYLDEHPDVDIVSTSTYFSKSEAIGNTLIDFDNKELTSTLKNGTPMLSLCHFQSVMFRRSCLDIFKNGVYFFPEYVGGFAGEGFLYVLHFIGKKKFANISNTYYIYNRGILENSLTNTIEPLYANSVNELPYNDKKVEITRLFKKYNS